MKIPEGPQLQIFTEELIQRCMTSQNQRITDGAYYKQYYYSGSDNGKVAMYNRCYPHVDRLASYLFSPGDVHFQINLDVAQRDWLAKLEVASRYLSYEFHRTGADLQFSHAVEWALCKGSSFIKTLWGSDGLECTVVQMETLGVLREDINGLDRQEAFNHQIFLTKNQFANLLVDHPERKEILQKIESAKSTKAEDIFEQSYLHQIIVGGTNPITNAGQGNPTNGMSQVFGGPVPQLAPDVRANLVLLNELWVWDDEREDWTTIQYVDSGIFVEGKLRRRNLTGVKGEQPFTQVCANHTDGYFWGRSEMAGLVLLQDNLNRRMSEVDRISRLRARPPRFITGSSGISDQERTAMNTPGGFVVQSTPTAKQESMAPDLPPELFEQIGMIINYFDDVGGFEAITKGQGESGVRSGVHAETLVRTATPRLRDRALQVERQCADLGDFCFKLLQAKSTRPFKAKDDSEFLLGQLPEEIKIGVDSHSSSPAFSQESKQLAAELLKSQAITPKEFIRLTHPPAEDILVENLEMREEAAQKEQKEIFEEAKKDPSLMEKIATKVFGGGKKK